MKRRFFLFLFLLVMVSLASNITAGVILNSVKVEMTEKEGKACNHEFDFEKDKIFMDYTVSIGNLNFLETKNLHPVIKFSSPTLGTEINPPDRRAA